MKNKYRNPWCNETLIKRPPFYENDAPEVYAYRGVVVFKVSEHHYDYVFHDCCISQRAGLPKNDLEKNEIIDAYLDGKILVTKEIVDHINAHGGNAKSYDEEIS